MNELKAHISSLSKSNDDEMSKELSSYKRLLTKARNENDELKHDIKLLQNKIDKSTCNSNSLVVDLREKLRTTEEKLRSAEREGRFEAALASEIANLRTGSRSSSNGSNKKSRSFDSADEGKGFTAPNAAYIIEMYDYVVELKHSIEEERQMYKELVSEHEDLLALLGQTGLDGAHDGDGLS
jgi:predicted  nucleic acid-binding Zn-ribbon protein